MGISRREDQEAEAHLGEDNMIKLVYKKRRYKIKEAEYMKLLAAYKGVPSLYYESSTNDDPPFIVTERLYEIKNKQSLNDIVNMALQMINLIETLYNEGIYHNHLEYFTFQKDNQIYFIDNRLWKYVEDNPDGVNEDLNSMIRCLKRIAKTSSKKFLNEMYEYLKHTEYVADKLTFARLRGICKKYQLN